MIAVATAMTMITSTISSPSRSRPKPPELEPPCDADDVLADAVRIGAVMTGCGSGVPQLPLAPPPPNLPPPEPSSEIDDEEPLLDPPLLKSQKSTSIPPDEPLPCAWRIQIAK